MEDEKYKRDAREHVKIGSMNETKRPKEKLKSSLSIYEYHLINIFTLGSFKLQ